jgi:hypothetical protein
MALQHTITVSGTGTINTKDGVVVLGDRSEALANAYIKVEAVEASKDIGSISVSITVATGSKIARKYTFTPSVASGSENFIKQAYEHLKTLPEFAGSTDV